MPRRQFLRRTRQNAAGHSLDRLDQRGPRSLFFLQVSLPLALFRGQFGQFELHRLLGLQPQKAVIHDRVGQEEHVAAPFLANEAEAAQPSSYRAYASLDQDYFRVRGEEAPLLAGMSATAEITTETKSLLSLLLEPFQELGKPSSAQP